MGPIPSVLPLISAPASNLQSGTQDGLGWWADDRGSGWDVWKGLEGFWGALGRNSHPGAEKGCPSPGALGSHPSCHLEAGCECRSVGLCGCETV